MPKSRNANSLALGSVDDLQPGSSPTASTTPPSGLTASGVGVPNRVRGTIEAGRLAVPEAKDAVRSGARKQAHLLTAPHGGGGKVLVDPRLEDDAKRFEGGGLAQKFHVQSPQRGAAVAGDETRRVAVGADVRAALIDRQASERLDAA